MLKVVVIEDESHILESTLEVLSTYCPNVEILGTAGTVAEGTNLLKTVDPDLVLMDVELPDGNSFRILEQIKKTDFEVVFITAFEEYAIKAIKFSALDYFLKPVDPLDLIELVKKVGENKQEGKDNVKLEVLLNNFSNPPDKFRKLVLKTAESIFLIDVRDIIRCESEGSYTMFFLKDGRRILVSEVLKNYEEMLDSYDFLRVHKSHLVNINYIDRFEKTEGGFLLMKDGSQVLVSVRKKKLLMGFFNRFVS